MKNKLFTAKVTPGHGTGKKLGFPTLNLSIPKDFNYPRGIYAGWVVIDPTKFIGAFHFGPVPTFNRPTLSLEVFVLDHHFSTPPSRIKFQLIKYLRPIKSFTNPQALAHQISRDVAQIKRLFAPS